MPSIKGIWRWKDAIDFSSVSGYITQDVNFTSNGESFRAIEIRPTLLFYYSSVSSGGEQIEVGGGTSVQDAYKQIDFGDTAQTVSDEFYAVFSANADATDFIIQMGAVYPVKLLTKGCYLDKDIRILPPPIDEPVFEERTVTPTAQTQEVTPGAGYDALSKVIVNAVPTETKSVTPTEQEQIIRGSEGSFLSSVSVKAIQASEKTVTENGEYTPAGSTYYKKVTVNVPQYTDVSATTAQADDVLQGKSFYPYNGSPLTEGTIPVQTPSNPEFTRKTDTATFPKGYYSSESTVKIADTEQAKIIPENIKKDTVILGVTGSYAGADVSDTTATQGDVLSGKYFYGSDGVKTEGTMTNHTETSITLNAGTGDQYVPAGHYSDILTKLVLNSDAASKIKQGEVILGVTGSYAGGGDQPQLNAPTISIAGTTLSIEDPTTNGNFTSGWKLYDDGAYADQFLTAVIQLANIQFSTGTHKLTVKSFGTNFKDSAASNEVTYQITEKLATPVVSISGSIINWELVPNASGYLISYSGTASGTQSVSAGTSSYDLEGLLSTSGTYTVTVTAKGSGDYIDSDPSNSVTYTNQEQLATPQNVTAAGTTVSWDAVENATSYAVLADGNEIGTVEKASGYTVTFICQNGMVGFKYSIDNMSANLRIDTAETKNIIVTEYLFIQGQGMTPEVVSYSGGTLEIYANGGQWIFTPTQNNATITVVDND